VKDYPRRKAGGDIFVVWLSTKTGKISSILYSMGCFKPKGGTGDDHEEEKAKRQINNTVVLYMTILYFEMGKSGVKLATIFVSYLYIPNNNNLCVAL
jgi:hypothetical protein